MLKSLFHSNILVNDLPLTNCETELHLSWKKDCVLIEHPNNITGLNFMITSTKLHATVVTWSINDNVKILENIKQEFKRTTSWNKYNNKNKNKNKII